MKMYARIGCDLSDELNRIVHLIAFVSRDDLTIGSHITSVEEMSDPSAIPFWDILIRESAWFDSKVSQLFHDQYDILIKEYGKKHIYEEIGFLEDPEVVQFQQASAMDDMLVIQVA